jgi:hypothetical protein
MAFGNACGSECTFNTTCSSHGRCLSSGLCECYPGWDGAACLACQDGFFGFDCEHACDDQTFCNDRGVCSNEFGHCNCDSNAAGKACDMCAADTTGYLCSTGCNHKTTCNARGRCLGDGTCECKEGYQGLYCEECSNGGFGEACELVCNASDTCSSNGRCEGDGTCACNGLFQSPACDVCTLGLGGPDCADTCVASRNCNANGRCLGDSTCECTEGSGYQGEECSDCFAGFYGDDCKRHCAANTTCSAHGRCTTQGVCECSANFVGVSCQTCAADLFGLNCDVFCRDETSCSGHGSCNGEGKCECTGGYAGASCDQCTAGAISTDYLVNITVNVTGNASASNVSSLVVESADSDSCRAACNFKSTCSSHGRCLGSVSTDLDACECMHGYVSVPASERQLGAECSTCEFALARFPFDTQCADYGSSSESISVHGETVCSSRRHDVERPSRLITAWPGDQPSPLICSGQGLCLSNTLCGCTVANVGGASCDVCKPGFTSETCFQECQRNTTCNGKGRCTGSSQCECDGGFTGANCLECMPGSTGPGCQAACTAKSSCSGHGRCDGDGKCICNANFKGESCSACEDGLFGLECRDECSDVVTCSGHGNCGSAGECICSEGYTGSACSECTVGTTTDACESETKCAWNTSCSGHGRCDGEGSCAECFGGYAGMDCSTCMNPLNGGIEVIGGQCADYGSSPQWIAVDGLVLCRATPGLKWQRVVGTSRPPQGQRLFDVDLMNALEIKTDFTETEWREFGIQYLSPDHYVESVGSYFTPAYAHSTCSGAGECLFDFDSLSQMCKCDDTIGGAACDSCLDSMHGADCKSQCSWNTTCNSGGRCTQEGGCECFVGGNAVGVLCQECPAGHFSADCSSTACSYNGTCSSHGRCRGDSTCECYDGWAGSSCESCAPGRFGDNCQGSCSDDSCNNGVCGPNGCECFPGFGGVSCTACSEIFGLNGCSAPCSAEDTCHGVGRCTPEGSCDCFPAFNCGRIRDVLAASLPKSSTIESGIGSMSGNEAQQRSIFDVGNGLILDAHRKEAWWTTLIDDAQQPELNRTIIDGVCATGAVLNECLPGCSGQELQECQDLFEACVSSIGGGEGTCECLGRLRMCSVDAGCKALSDPTVLGLCDAMQCTQGQCQLFYPQPTHCDWDTNAWCNDQLSQCLDQPDATVILAPCVERESDSAGIFLNSANCGEMYAVEEAKYAQRCRCHGGHTETFSFSPAPTCTAKDTRASPVQSHFSRQLVTNPALDEGWLPIVGRGLGWRWQRLQNAAGDTQYRYLMQARNSSLAETWASFPARPRTWDYSSVACLSSCMNEVAQASRILQIAYDCAVCGDGEWMPGREECDDGNRIDGDGCSSECKVEVPVQVNADVHYSPASSNPGTVTLTWNHSQLSLMALLSDAPGQYSDHDVLHYNVIVLRRRRESFSADGHYEPGSINRTEVSLLPFFGDNCGDTMCWHSIHEVMGGEILSVTLTAENVAGLSTVWAWEARWETLPFGLMHVQYQDSVPLQTLSWVAPPSTGLGNDFEMPILTYVVEVSRCSDFRTFDTSVTFDPALNYEREVYSLQGNATKNTSTYVTTVVVDACSAVNCSCELGIPTTLSPLRYDCGCGCVLTENTWCESSTVEFTEANNTFCEDQGNITWCASRNFSYPLVYNVTKYHPGLHQGLFYYYRVTAKNRLGFSNTSDVLLKQFGKIPFPISFISYPTVFPVPGEP